MPALLGRDDKQFDAIDANKSRFVTKCRWVVEVVNSFLKSFKATETSSKQVTAAYISRLQNCGCIY